MLLPPSVGRGGVPPYFCNGFGLRRHFCSTRPLRLTMPTSAPASTFCMRPRLGSRIDPLALPETPPAPRSELECKFLPLICSPGRRTSGAGDPDMLACHALLNAMSSRTKSPELPLVLYQTATVLSTDFTGCQRPGNVGAVELETGSPQSKTFARSYTDYGTRNQKAAGEESYVARKPSVFPGVCV